MIKRFQWLILLLLISIPLLFWLFFNCEIGSAKTITVNDDGGADYGTIQDAIDNAMEGDTIRVWEGTYYENVEVDKSMSLSGNGSDIVTIDGGDQGAVLRLERDNISIHDLSIINGNGAGIQILEDDVEIEDCTISYNDYGIFLEGAGKGKPTREIGNYTYGGSAEDSFAWASSTSDGGFIVTGSTESYGGSDPDIWLVKLNDKGEKEWDRVIQNTPEDQACHVFQTSDGGYLISGYTELNANDIWIVKTNDSGIVEWEENYGSSTHDRAYAGAIETPDGGFVVAGYNGKSQTYADACLMKVNATGKFLWEKFYGGSNSDVFSSFTPLVEGGYILVGFTKSYGNDHEVFIVKTDENGGEIWDKYYGGPGNDRGKSVVVVDDGYLVGGYYETSNNGREMWLLELDNDGDIVDSKFYGGAGDEWLDNIHRMEDGGFLLIGGTYSYGSGNSDMWLLKLNENYDEEWNMTFGGEGNDLGKSIIMSGNNLNLFGRTDSFGAGNKDFWMLKFKGIIDNITISNSIISSNRDMGIYANGTSNLRVEQCNIYNNGDFGVKASLDDQLVTATNNWWGDVSGPYHALKNPGGTGNTISDYVDFDPWLITPIDYFEPEAFIDSILPEFPTEGEEIQFSGHGNVYDSAVRHVWKSSVNGEFYNDTSPNCSNDTLSPGSHEISYKVLDNIGTWSEEVSMALYINRIPIASIQSISPKPALPTDHITYQGSGFDDGTIMEYYWRIVNDTETTVYSGPTPPTSLPIGLYTIYLKVRDDLGVWSEEVSTTLLVHERPGAQITVDLPAKALNTDNLTLDGKGFDDGSIIRYVWTSNIDGEFYNGTNPKYNVSMLSPGTHNISLKVQDNHGAWSAPVSETIIIHRKPTASIISISPSPQTEGKSVQFEGEGDDDGFITHYIWHSSIDGEIYNGTNTKFSTKKLSIGIHIITFKVKDNYGVLSDDDQAQIEIKEEKEKDFLFQDIGPFPLFLYIIIGVIVVGGVAGGVRIRKRSAKKRISPLRESISTPTATQQKMIGQPVQPLSRQQPQPFQSTPPTPSTQPTQPTQQTKATQANIIPCPACGKAANRYWETCLHCGAKMR